MELIAPCHFGLEAVLKKEIQDLGYDITSVEDGRVTFAGDAQAICRANIFLATAERILLKVGEWKVETFEELFDRTKALPWEDFIPKDGKFWVTKASSVKSKLFSPSDIQSIVKKAIVERLKGKYHKTWFEETGAEYPIRVFLKKDVAVIGLDTTGESLHKRGYRLFSGKAPLSETLACALLLLTPWNRDRILVDPLCGSGTFAIEAARMAANMAPGMDRQFLSMNWDNLFGPGDWEGCQAEARVAADPDIATDIQAYDIDEEMIKGARENARRAGVEHLIHFQRRPLREMHSGKKYGFLITNPPYGERIAGKAPGGEGGQVSQELRGVYRELGQVMARLETWSSYVLTAYEGAEQDMGRKAEKNRKIYNGMIKAYFYQFPGPKPPRRKRAEGVADA